MGMVRDCALHIEEQPGKLVQWDVARVMGLCSAAKCS
jgi:hypothetical protein